MACRAKSQDQWPGRAQDVAASAHLTKEGEEGRGGEGRGRGQGEWTEGKEGTEGEGPSEGECDING